MIDAPDPTSRGGPWNQRLRVRQSVLVGTAAGSRAASTRLQIRGLSKTSGCLTDRLVGRFTSNKAVV